MASSSKRGIGVKDFYDNSSKRDKGWSRGAQLIFRLPLAVFCARMGQRKVKVCWVFWGCVARTTYKLLYRSVLYFANTYLSDNCNIPLNFIPTEAFEQNAIFANGNILSYCIQQWKFTCNTMWRQFKLLKLINVNLFHWNLLKQKMKKNQASF